MPKSFVPKEERHYRRQLLIISVYRLLFFFVIVGLVFLLFSWLKYSESTKREARRIAEKKAVVVGEELQEAIKAKDSEAIQEKYESLKSLAPSELGLRHLLWIGAAITQDAAFAESLQKQLAPVDGAKGYGPSHFLVGKTLFAKKNPAKEDAELMLLHFRAASISDQVSNSVFVYLGDVLYATKRFGKAIESYRKVDPLTPDLQYRIAMATGQTEKRANFRNEMRYAADLYEKKVSEEPDDLRAYVNWTKALFHAGMIDKAEGLLMKRLEQDDNDVIRNELIQAYLAQLRFEGDVERRKEMLKRICELDPNLEINPNTRKAFFGLANYLVNEKRFEEARTYYLASAQKIKFPASVKNNLAWVELNRPGGKLDEAIQLSNEAIDESANPPAEFFGTRGQILAKLGRWKAAHVDLEKATVDAAQKDESRLALAVVYSRIGDREKGEQMFKLAQSSFTSLDELLATYPD